jgi:hypothetical protein
MKRGGLDPDDPQAAEIPLLGPPVAVGVEQGLLDGLLGRPVIPALGSEISLGQAEDFPPPVSSLGAASDAWHDRLLVSEALLHLVREHGLEGLAVRRAGDGRPAQVAFALGGLLGQDVAFIRLGVEKLFLGRDLDPLLRSLVGF